MIAYELMFSGAFPGSPRRNSRPVLGPDGQGWSFQKTNGVSQTVGGRRLIKATLQSELNIGFRLRLYTASPVGPALSYSAFRTGHSPDGPYVQDRARGQYNLNVGEHQTHIRRIELESAAIDPGIPGEHTPVPELRRMIEQPAGHQWPRGWPRWENSQKAFIESMADYATSIPAYPGGYSGRGVVIVGGGRYFPSAYIGIRVLRHVGCDLPAELWHLPGEIDGPRRSLFERWGVRCIECADVAGGWQLKPWATLHSQYEQVLYLDADCYPIRDPGYLFDQMPQGAAFWPDQPMFDVRPEVWRAFGLPPRKEWSFESGQYLVDKSKCWAPLNLTVWLNQNSHYCYEPDGWVWGDKETYHLAWRYLGYEYQMAPKRWVGSSPAGCDGHTLVHFDHQNRPIFQHRCRAKFTLGEGFTTTPQTGANVHNAQLEHEDFAFACLEELKRSGIR